jgi:hypothetical protein
MRIDYDDIAVRLSTSSPIDTQLYSQIPPDLSSPSTHSEPPIHTKSESNSELNSPSVDNYENNLQKSPSWLNTVNTITTTMEGFDERMFFS